MMWNKTGRSSGRAIEGESFSGLSEDGWRLTNLTFESGSRRRCSETARPPPEPTGGQAAGWWEGGGLGIVILLLLLTLAAKRGRMRVFRRKR